MKESRADHERKTSEGLELKTRLVGLEQGLKESRADHERKTSEGLELKTRLVELEESRAEYKKKSTEQMELQIRLVGLEQELKESRADHAAAVLDKESVDKLKLELQNMKQDQLTHKEKTKERETAAVSK